MLNSINTHDFSQCDRPNTECASHPLVICTSLLDRLAYQRAAGGSWNQRVVLTRLSCLNRRSNARVEFAQLGLGLLAYFDLVGHGT
jgi:hypothetical protein